MIYAEFLDFFFWIFPWRQNAKQGKHAAALFELPTPLTLNNDITQEAVQESIKLALLSRNMVPYKSVIINELLGDTGKMSSSEKPLITADRQSNILKITL